MLVILASCGGGSSTDPGGRKDGGDASEVADILPPRDPGSVEWETDAAEDPPQPDAPFEDIGSLDDQAGEAPETTEVPDHFQRIDLQAVGNVRAMWASPLAGIWAVGDRGLVLWHDGHDFVPAPLPPTDRDLFGVSGQDATVVAVGAAGTVIRWDQGAWELLPAPGPGDLFGVGVLSADEFYVSGRGGALYHFQNGTWSPEPTGITYDLYGVHASQAGGVFAVGVYGTLIELRGGHWIQSQIALPTTTLRAIWRAPDGRMFAVGSGGGVSLFDGLTWKLQITGDPSDPPRDLYAVTGFSADEVYAVGDRGVILRYNGKKWTLMTIAGPYHVFSNLRAVAGLLDATGNRTVFAAGLDSEAVRLDDKVWRDTPLGVTSDLRGVAVDADGRVLAVGERGLILAYRDGRFFTIRSGTSNDLLGIAGRTAVGANGTALRIEDSTAVPVFTGLVEDLNDAFEVGGVTWVAGAQGTLLRLSGADQQVIQALQGAALEAICVSGGAVYVAGRNGAMFVDEGHGFHAVVTATTATLWDLWPAGTRRAIAAGDYGLLLSCDPVSCRRLAEDPTTFLYGLGGVQDGLALAVGWAGAVRRVGFGEEVIPLDAGTFEVFRAVGGPGPDRASWLVGPGGTFYVYRP